MSKPKPLFNRLALIGVGLIGSSIARAARAQGTVGSIVATARSPATRRRVAELGLADQVVETNAAAVEGADLVIVCIPVGACGPVAQEIGPHLAPGAIVSDVGSVKGAIVRDMAPHLPRSVHFVPAHPVAGTEYSGPDAGFAELFVNRWCILTPPDGTEPAAVDKLARFWELLGANVDLMAPDHHDLVLAITSHLPHLIAYTIVGTADELQTVTRSEVLKFSAGGFRDFTRIAASDPTMWRDVFLANKDAVLEMLGRFNEDIALLTKAIRNGDGETLVRSVHAHPRHPQGHRRYRPGFCRARLRPPASRPAAAPQTLRGGRGLIVQVIPGRRLCAGPGIQKQLPSFRSGFRVRSLREHSGMTAPQNSAGVTPIGIGPSSIAPSSKRSGSAKAGFPSSVAGWPMRLRPSEIFAPACWRAASPRPGDRRSSMPASLSICEDFCTISRAPIAFRNGSMPATVMRNSPCSRPSALSESAPSPTATVSPCCKRMRLISMRPPAA